MIYIHYSCVYINRSKAEFQYKLLYLKNQKFIKKSNSLVYIIIILSKKKEYIARPSQSAKSV